MNEAGGSREGQGQKERRGRPITILLATDPRKKLDNYSQPEEGVRGRAISFVLKT